MGLSTYVSRFFGLNNDPKKKPEEEYSISTADIPQDLFSTNIDYDQTSDLNESTISLIFSEEIPLDASSEFEDDVNNRVTLEKRNLSRSSSSTSGPDRKLAKFYHPRSSFLENKERFEGHLDYLDPIPVDAIPGHLYAMIVLWYFHVKYAVMNLDGG